MKKIVILLLITGFVLFSKKAGAMLIVDTGEPPAIHAGNTLNSGQYLAGRFQTHQDYLVTDISGWIWTIEQGNLDVFIYGSVESTTFPFFTVPDITDIYLQDTVFIDAAQEGSVDWRGLSGLSINLEAGDYWLAFEVTDSINSFTGAMGSSAPHPLSDNALANNNTGFAYGNTGGNHHMGFRVAAEPVPEPTTVALLGIGLAGLVSVEVRRRRKRKSVDKS